ncbi:MAG: type II toxin-antitoxin system RelE/ParE family toxin [Deltaproteobacteria bacterium]|nr:type II toxin-antitoxin system RelE/ParE family toxin [Deltaproteobacteria bacterium]
MKPIILRPEARMDALAAYRWYENQRPGLGRDFREALEQVINSLREKPKSYPVVLRETRRVLLKRFPYMVFYREYDDAIVIVAVMHGKRDPETWRQRL